MDAVSRLNAAYPQAARFARTARPGTKAGGGSPGAPDSVEISDEARALGETAPAPPPPPPTTYGPPKAQPAAGGQSGLDADTTRSRRLTELMAEIEAVQESTASLIDRYRLAS